MAKKTEFPAEEELVLCTVTGINPHSVFAVMDEYNKRTGLVHISEVAPGRIRNIRDYVKEGKKIVCKVLRVDKERGHIDLSIRRVNEAQKREKTNQIKEEQLAEKILEQVAKARSEEPAVLYEAISQKVLAQYTGVYPCLVAVALSNASLEKLGIEKTLAQQITTIVKERIKPPEVKLTGDFKLQSHAPNGIELIKKALAKAGEASGNKRIAYTGAGTYHLTVIAEDYKDAERMLKKVTDDVLTSIQKDKGTGTFTRHEGGK